MKFNVKIWKTKNKTPEVDEVTIYLQSVLMTLTKITKTNAFEKFEVTKIED